MRWCKYLGKCGHVVYAVGLLGFGHFTSFHCIRLPTQFLKNGSNSGLDSQRASLVSWCCWVLMHLGHWWEQTEAQLRHTWHQSTLTWAAHTVTCLLQPSHLPKDERPVQRRVNCWPHESDYNSMECGVMVSLTDKSTDKCSRPKGFLNSKCGQMKKRKHCHLKGLRNRCSAHIVGDSLQPFLATANLYDKLDDHLRSVLVSTTTQEQRGVTCSACRVAPLEQPHICSANCCSFTETTSKEAMARGAILIEEAIRSTYSVATPMS